MKKWRRRRQAPAFPASLSSTSVRRIQSSGGSLGGRVPAAELTVRPLLAENHSQTSGLTPVS